MSNYTPEDIDNVAKALRQVVSVNPQLLYKAAQQVYVDLTLDILNEDCQETPNRKRRDAFTFRCSLCLWISRLLLQSGRAQMDGDDMAALFAYTNLMDGTK